ncbi:MAG: hypothetical protein IJF92_01895 [Bacilli bacterium]|nr:hypothetical protein [Bacilli bacterium]
MSKSVLVTNFNIVNYTGSELDTITIANYFLDNNYDVDILTFKYSNPLKRIVNKNINVYTFENIEKLKNKYEIIWSHHFPILDYVIFNKNIKADYIHYVSLSSFEPYECLPAYYKELSLVSTISKEAEISIKNECDVDLNIFPNYAPEDYFSNRKQQNSSKIKKICVVSNHVPDELGELKEIFETDGVKFDIFGIQYKSVKVDDKLLKKYDVVITIGKTVNYSLSLGIPVYCYDYMGGDGYITKDNIKNSYAYNFSGRYTGKKKTAKQIYNDINNNYKTACDNIESNYKYAYDHFNYNRLMEETLNKIKQKKVNLKQIIDNNVVLKRKSALFIREVVNSINQQEIYEKTIRNYQKIIDHYNKLLDDSNNELYRILNSNSWKITKPLRWFTSKFKKIIEFYDIHFIK